MNTIETMLSEPWAQALGWALLHFLWQGVLVAILLASVLWLFRGRRANIRYVAGCAAMLLMLLLAIASFWFILDASSSGKVAGKPAPAPAASAALRSPLGLATSSDARPEAYVLPSSSLEQYLYRYLTPWLPWLILAWTAGVFVLSLGRFREWLCAQYFKDRKVRPLEDARQQRFLRLCAQLRVTRPVRLFESVWVEVPTVIGWLRPVILLPASALSGLTPQHLEALITHELAHIRRYDYLVNLLQTLIETLLFYHPAVWWVSHRVRVERENCCDDLAVAACGDPQVYVRALEKMEHLRTPPVPLTVAANDGVLLNRIRRLVEAPSQHTSGFAGWLAGLFVVMGITGIAVVGIGAGTLVTKVPEHQLVSCSFFDDIRLYAVDDEGNVLKTFLNENFDDYKEGETSLKTLKPLWRGKTAFVSHEQYAPGSGPGSLINLSLPRNNREDIYEITADDIPQGTLLTFEASVRVHGNGLVVGLTRPHSRVHQVETATIRFDHGLIKPGWNGKDAEHLFPPLPYEKERWYKVKAIVNLQNHTMDVFLDDDGRPIWKAVPLNFDHVFGFGHEFSAFAISGVYFEEESLKKQDRTYPLKVQIINNTEEKVHFDFGNVKPRAFDRGVDLGGGGSLILEFPAPAELRQQHFDYAIYSIDPRNPGRYTFVRNGIFRKDSTIKVTE